MKLITLRAAVRIAILFLVLAAVVVYSWTTMIRMPGQSFEGELPPWTETETDLAELLVDVVVTLADAIGERNVWTPDSYENAAAFIEERFRAAGHQVRREEYQAGGVISANIEAEMPGTARPEEILIIGAHYDTVSGSPGANDNASGVAGTIALAKLLADRPMSRTVRFVAFANEEAPFFQTEEMGSMHYARRARERGEKIVGMISLETIGDYSDDPGSQQYPFPLSMFYPSRGNFIGFVSHTGSPSSSLLRNALSIFREETDFPSEGATLPETIPGVGWSDHWSFWQADYPAFMVTDTAPYRYPHYHLSTDTPDQLDYLRMARVVKGMEAVVRGLAGPEAP